MAESLCNQMPVSSISMGRLSVSIWSFYFIFPFLFLVLSLLVLLSLLPMVHRSQYLKINVIGIPFDLLIQLEQKKLSIILQDDYIFTYRFPLLVLLKLSGLTSLLSLFALRRFQLLHFYRIN